MGQLILEFPLAPGSVVVDGLTLRVDLGNGCKLVSTVPEWVKVVESAVLRLEMEIVGSPHAEPGTTPVE
jgi:hypothetical protein